MDSSSIVVYAAVDIDVKRGDDETGWLVNGVLGSGGWRNGRNALFLSYSTRERDADVPLPIPIRVPTLRLAHFPLVPTGLRNEDGRKQQRHRELVYA